MIGFEAILKASAEVSADVPDCVFIGGVAIYLHAVNQAKSGASFESSHDSDFMVSLYGFSMMRDAQVLTPNPRLGKHQLIYKGVEFDVYVERQHYLAVPYDDVAANAVDYEGLKVAVPEHLLILKLEAFMDREKSPKGEKDERDLVTIAVVSHGKARSSLLVSYLRQDHVDALRKVARGRVFMDICKGNVHAAKKLKQLFADYASSVERCLS